MFNGLNTKIGVSPPAQIGNKKEFESSLQNEIRKSGGSLHVRGGSLHVRFPK